MCNKNIFIKLVVVLFSLLRVTRNQMVSNCYDEEGETTCYYWRVSGMCQAAGYRNYMYQICRKTCNLCPSVYIPPYHIPTQKRVKKRNSCRDRRSRCPGWKEYCPEGNGYYQFMQKHCPRTCLHCVDKMCKDSNPKCKQYEVFGYCEPTHRYFGYMKKTCPKSCHFCISEKVNRTSNSSQKQAPKNLKKEFVCNFEENECDWSNQLFEDSGDWTVGIDTNGPKTGFDNSTKYLHTDVTYRGYFANLWLPWQLVLPENSNNRATITSGEKDEIMCFHFMYQLFNGRLLVQESKNPTMHDKQPKSRTLFETGTKSENWTLAQVSVHANNKYNLMIVGERYLKKSYISLDDFYFTKGKC